MVAVDRHGFGIERDDAAGVAQLPHGEERGFLECRDNVDPTSFEGKALEI